MFSIRRMSQNLRLYQELHARDESLVVNVQRLSHYKCWYGL